MFSELEEAAEYIIFIAVTVRSSSSGLRRIDLFSIVTEMEGRWAAVPCLLPLVSRPNRNPRTALKYLTGFRPQR